jgi:methylmalonyl-CoA mutase C-terminal domain/subunit
MERQGINDKIVTVGGIIPKKDVNRLMEFGIAKVFRPSDTTSEIAGFIEGEVQRKGK